MFIHTISTLTVVILIKNIESSSIDERMVNGLQANLTEFPYYARLALKDFIFGLDFCTCTIITEKYLLSSGQCVELIYRFSNDLNKKLFVEVGSEKKHPLLTNMIYQVEKIYFSPQKYIMRMKKMNHDPQLSLIKLNKPIKFALNINKATLPRKGKKMNIGDQGIIASIGIGKQNSTDYIELDDFTTLKSTKVSVVKNNDCEKSFNMTLNDFLFCVKSVDGNLCENELGSGLIVDKKTKTNKTIQVIFGVVAQIYPACKSNLLVMMSVSAYREWIDICLQGNCPSDIHGLAHNLSSKKTKQD